MDMMKINDVELLQKKIQDSQDCTIYEPPTRHHFHGGMYCREVFREAGVMIIGKVHKKEHFYLVASGTVIINDGSGSPVEVRGPSLFKSSPGVKRAVFALTDALCMTFHKVDGTPTLEALEKELVEEETGAMFGVGNVLKREVLK